MYILKNKKYREIYITFDCSFNKNKCKFLCTKFQITLLAF